MKQSLVSGRGSVTTMYTPDEFEVADIVLHLQNLISKFESPLQLPFGWGSKRKRSAIAQDPPIALSSSPPPLSPLLPRTANGECRTVALSSETVDGSPTVKNQASSPATPLSFSPSESDDKPQSTRKLSVKRKRENLLTKIEELSRSRDLLLGEIENVKRYYKELGAFNLRLRAKKRELTLGLENAKGIVGLDSKLSKPTVEFSSQLQHQRQIAVLDQITRIGEGFKHPSWPMESCTDATTSWVSPSIGLVASNGNVGPCLPDLNICLDETVAVNSAQPFDMKVPNVHVNRAMAAQARQNRIRIYRVKNSIAAHRIRYSCG